MKAYQINDLIVRLSIATGVVLAMIVTVLSLTNVSQHHIERDLAKYAVKDCKVVQLAKTTTFHKT
ncbi:hypothetical protein [Chitinimonas sp. BJB300]|uniref:hypothetical protein n=1 Tax=Chitinimonas sp. BJB300 TaxID=1559339 RepID=UPI001111D73A|nr:hypothetical protein [Chitinimonas sp. BJB300]TSJ91043.1 hypothetical protein FG002_001670 [Chitinimonas sp. BJB300]